MNQTKNRLSLSPQSDEAQDESSLKRNRLQKEAEKMTAVFHLVKHSLMGGDQSHTDNDLVPLPMETDNHTKC